MIFRSMQNSAVNYFHKIETGDIYELIFSQILFLQTFSVALFLRIIAEVRTKKPTLIQ